jgi:hypothetical protein
MSQVKSLRSLKLKDQATFSQSFRKEKGNSLSKTLQEKPIFLWRANTEGFSFSILPLNLLL